MNPLLKLVQDLARKNWPLNATEVEHCGCTVSQNSENQFEQHHVTFKHVGFSFSCLETLWDPRMTSKQSRHAVSPLPLPRAVYEQDTSQWIKAPLLSDGTKRDILHLTCLVWNTALHVYDDADRMRHIDLFSKIVDAEYAAIAPTKRTNKHQSLRSIKISEMTDESILKDEIIMYALMKAAGVHIFLERDGKTVSSGHEHSLNTTDSSAWFVCDSLTNTWGARVFGSHSLVASREDVRNCMDQTRLANL